MRSRGLPGSKQLREFTLGDRFFDRAGIIAGIEQAAGRGAVRERIGGDEVAADHVEWIAPQLDRDALHEPLERVIDLRTAETAVEPARRFVGEHHAVAHRDVTDVIGAGEVAVHAVERRRLGRAQVRTHVLDLVPVERADAAVVIDRRRKPRHAVGGRDRADKMLEPILDPFDRPAGDARGDADEHHVRHEALLDAEAAAGVGRRAQAQPIARHLERARHHRVQAERPHEIGEDVVGVFARVVRGDDPVGLDRRAGIARVADLDRDAVRRRGEGRVGIAVAERAVARDV